MSADTPTGSQVHPPATAMPSLVDDLQTVLFGDLEFDGRLCVGAMFPDAPNPGLQIEEIGLVGLPVSNRDLQLLMATTTSSNTGDSAIPDGQYLIDPWRISFANPKWHDWLGRLVLGPAVESLGLAVYMADKSMIWRFRGLTIEIPSSKACTISSGCDDVIASARVLLPSAYDGGDITLSHQGWYETFDLSQSSKFLETFIYVRHGQVLESQHPITRGFRIALQYDLTHIDAQDPTPLLPCLPGLEAARRKLRHTLDKWARNEYSGHLNPSLPLLSCVLHRRYGEEQLSKGCRSLCGADTLKLSCLVPLAEELGFFVMLANLWSIKDLAYNPLSGPLSDNDCFRLRCVSDLDGQSLLATSRYQLSESNILPKGFFEGGSSTPDEDVTLRPFSEYFRTVILISRAQDDLTIMNTLGGRVEWGIARLRSPSRPGSYNDADAISAIAHAMDKVTETDRRSSSVMQGALILTGYAIQHKDANLWNQSIARITSFPDTTRLVSVALEAVELLPFTSIQEGLENVLKHIPRVEPRLRILSFVRSFLREDVRAVQWVASWSHETLKMYQNPSGEEAPALIALGILAGFQCLTSALDSLSIPDDIDGVQFCLQLVEATHGAKACIPADLSWRFIESWLKMAVLKLTIVQPMWRYDVNTDLVLATTNMCLKTGTRYPCYLLFAHIIKIAHEQETEAISLMLPVVYTPFFSKLKEVLHQHHLSLASPPFGDAVLVFVRLLLVKHLGPKPSYPNPPVPRPVGCGCETCNSLDAYLLGTDDKIQFKETPEVREHLIRRLKGTHFCEWKLSREYGNPAPLIVTKVPALIEPKKWAERSQMITTFLQSLGNDGELQQLFGSYEYQCISVALAGVRSYEDSKVNSQPTD
ncbi:hypothetical protein BKA70DRAFT_1201230 [Coprinopsis sp. MPI-PUGE-AT-0042]|nr:hypothetical protein BKA70DRAFT_1201230 [Coprinopsis sp. MPI-PUGE-AT-0042]